MNWLPDTDKEGNVSATSRISECRRYRIAAFRSMGELFYEVWDGKHHMACRLPSADAAKAVVNHNESKETA